MLKPQAKQIVQPLNPVRECHRKAADIFRRLYFLTMPSASAIIIIFFNCVFKQIPQALINEIAIARLRAIAVTVTVTIAIAITAAVILNCIYKITSSAGIRTCTAFGTSSSAKFLCCNAVRSIYSSAGSGNIIVTIHNNTFSFLF